MLTPASGAIRYKNSKRQKIVAREQVAFLSLFSNVVEAVDLQKETLIMKEETENVHFFKRIRRTLASCYGYLLAFKVLHNK